MSRTEQTEIPAGTGSAAELVTELEALGVQLWEDDGALRYRAPAGVLTAERIQRLKAVKADLLDYLRAVARTSLTPEPGARHEPFPLSDIQAAYLVGRRSAVAYGGVGCHAYGELTYPDLDPEVVVRAWRQLVDRHDMLRAVIDPAGAQRVLAEVPPLDVPVTDLRSAPADAVAAALDTVRAELDHKVYEPDQWPLFDVRVTRHDGGAVLHLSIDFLIADFVSIQILLAEFDELRRHPDAQLPVLEIGYRDYALAERALRRNRQYERDRRYWWDRIDELPEAPDLPLAARPDAGTPRFRRHTMRLDAAAHTELGAIAARHDLTPSTALLGAYADVLARWSRRDRFTVNVTLLQRLPVHPQVDRLVGDFTSALLLTVDREGATPAERAARVQRQLWTDLDHRLVSGVEVIRELARRRGTDAALMPIVYTSALGLGTAARDDTPDGPRPGAGLSQTPQVWIDCQVMAESGGLVINWDVREGVLAPGVAEHMFAAFRTRVEALAADPGAWTDAAPIPLPSSQARVRAEVNATGPAAGPALLHAAVIEQCRRDPGRTAVIAEDRSLAYGELLARATDVATRLTAAGVAVGDVVAIVMPPGWRQVVSVLGILLAGGAYLPIDPRQPAARRDGQLADARARHVLTADPAVTLPLPVTVVGDDPAPATSEMPPEPATDPGDLAYIIFTSGSTGRPKGVMISHAAAWNTVADVNRRFRVGPADRVFGLSSLSFDLSVYDLFGPLSVGGALVVPAPQRRGDPSHWADLIERHGVTIWNSVPAQMQMMQDFLRLETGRDLSALRLAMLSGDWIPVGLPDAIRGLLPRLRVVSLGGATEASIWSILHPIDVVPPDWVSIPYGRPMAAQTCTVVGPDGQPCPDWVLGELHIGGAGVALGYVGDAEQTARRFYTDARTGERRYRTGDLGRYLPDGVIQLAGRDDQQVKIRGHRIELSEIETALAAEPTVAQAAVVVEGEAPLGRRLVAFVEPARLDAGAVAGRAELPRAMRRAASEELAVAHRELDGEHVVEFARRLDRTALLAMAAALRSVGLFAEPQTAYHTDEIMAGAAVAPRHHRLIRRWLQALRQHGMVRVDDRGRWSGLVEAGEQDTADAWQRVYDLLPQGGQRSELVEYFHTTSKLLPELMQGDADPVQLLFPEGRLDIQESAYQGNFLSGVLNRLVVAAVREIVRAHDRPGVRILEIGAGVGGTSMDLIPALDGLGARYLFTDVSQFFLTSARKRFGSYPWVDYGLFDLNDGPREQGFPEADVDVVLCANVLHYSRDVTTVLNRLRTLLRPGGWLVFIETTRDNYQILTSMEFLFDGTAEEFRDVRAGRDETFIRQDDWSRLLAEAGGDPVIWLSEGDEALNRIGMHAAAVRFRADRADPDPAVIQEHLRDRLPDYMLPSRIEVIESIPLSANDKVDRNALTALAATSTAPAAAGQPAVDTPAGDLEQALAAVYADVLQSPAVGRTDDIFRLGGDSLVAAQLAGRIRDEVPGGSTATFDELLRDLLEGATVADLAARLGPGAATAADGPAGPASPLVLVADGDSPTVQVLVHDDDGDIGTLLAHLRPGTRALGLVVADPGGYLATDPRTLLSDSAAAYAELLSASAGRPVELIGRGIGGLLAVEIAAALQESGAQVAAVTVVAGGADEGSGSPMSEHSRRAAHEHEGTLFAGDLTLVIEPGTGLPGEVTDTWRERCLGELAVVLRDHAAEAVR